MDVVVFLSRILLFLYQKGNGRQVCFRMFLGVVCKGIQLQRVEQRCQYCILDLLYCSCWKDIFQTFYSIMLVFLKVLFQKCEQYFKLFITYCKDNIRIVFLFVGCIIYLLYFFISQNPEVQYLVLGVLCSRFLILYIQFLELYMLCIYG